MLSFNVEGGSIFWDYANKSEYQFDPDCIRYDSIKTDYGWNWKDRYSYWMSGRETSVDIPKEIPITRDIENIIIIDLFGINESDKRGSGIGTKMMNQFIKAYGNDYNIFLNVGVLIQEDKELIDKDQNMAKIIIERIVNFYKKSGFMVLRRSFDESLPYGYKVLMMRPK